MNNGSFMTQTSFSFKSKNVTTEKISVFKGILNNIYRQIETSLPDRVKREQILTGRVLTRDDIEFRKKPETVTEELIVIPILEFLGFVRNKSYFRFTGATESESQKECDLTLLTEQEKILVESEPMGKNLFHKNVGVNQLTGYLENKSFRSGIGITTNGFRWILVKYNDEVFKSDIVRDIDLLPVFKKMGGLSAIENPDDLLNDFLATFLKENIINVVRKQELELTIARERVSKRFYDDYIKYVFGISEKYSHNYCLLDAIEPAETDEDTKRSFAVTLMNRLIFIKFLEDRVLKRSNLLNDLLVHYNSNKRTIPSTFYKSFLSPLFYDVFNTNVNKREENISKFYLFENIPYLNGGLFRESIKNEKSLNVKDDILQAIITNLLIGYTFNISMKQVKSNSPEEEFNALDPDILGYVFEKTINFLTAPGEKEARKMVGAYYTPDTITNQISKDAIFSVVMEKLREGLRESGWTDSDISKYQTISDLAEFPPMHPDTMRRLSEKVDTIKILDPACGSGHFLTSALKLIVFIKRKIIEPSKDVDVYELKRRAISQNLYGVDIEAPAVEIAKLRLWLSLIEELNADNIASVKTLPNIEYNVVHGNSLIGWNDESMLQMVAHEADLKGIRDKLSGLEIAYVDDIEKYKLLKVTKDRLASEFPHLEDLKEAYTSLKRIYIEEQGERAVLLKGILETVRSTIYSVVTPTFENYIKAEFNGNSRNREMPRIENPIHWSLDFNEAFEGGGFDIIIGNPPYGASFSKNEKDYLKSKYTSSKGNGNSAMMFIERSINLLRPGGHLGFIVPKSLAFSQKWEDGRNLILEDLNSVLDVSKAFKDVKLEQMIINIKKGSKPKTYALERTDSPTKLYVKKHFVTSTQTILLAGSKEEIKIFQKLNRSGKKFGNVTDTNRGLPLQSKLNKNNEGLPVLRGEDISRFYYKTPSVFLKPEEINRYDAVVKRMRDSPKIVSQRIVAHVKKPIPHILIMAAVDRKGMISVDTVENTYLRDKEYSLDTLCAIMNSRLVEWYAYRFIFANAIRSMDLDRYYVSKIPLPSKTSNLLIVDGLVSGLTATTSSDGISVDGDLLDRINKAIYEAYGLSMEESNLIDSLTVS